MAEQPEKRPARGVTPYLTVGGGHAEPLLCSERTLVEFRSF